jgi:hypothetical protein
MRRVNPQASARFKDDDASKQLQMPPKIQSSKRTLSR